MENVSSSAIEAAINKCRNELGTDGGVLPADARALADVWGLMIYRGQKEVPADSLPEKARVALQRWGE